jgi:hypothetical protein
MNLRKNGTHYGTLRGCFKTCQASLFQANRFPHHAKPRFRYDVSSGGSSDPRARTRGEASMSPTDGANEDRPRPITDETPLARQSHEAWEKRPPSGMSSRSRSVAQSSKEVRVEISAEAMNNCFIEEISNHTSRVLNNRLSSNCRQQSGS